MLIDFRVRPPYKTNLTTSLYNKPAPSPDPTKQSIFLIGKERVPSAEARSIELFMQEMDETETERAVIMAARPTSMVPWTMTKSTNSRAPIRAASSPSQASTRTFPDR